MFDYDPREQDSRDRDDGSRTIGKTIGSCWAGPEFGVPARW